MSELAKRVIGGKAKFATGTVVEGANTRLFTVSGLNFKPTHFAVVIEKTDTQQSHQGVLYASNHKPQWYIYYSGYYDDAYLYMNNNAIGIGYGSDSMTYMLNADGFTINIAQTQSYYGFVSGYTYRWYAWVEG